MRDDRLPTHSLIIDDHEAIDISNAFDVDSETRNEILNRLVDFADAILTAVRGGR